jgi:hypothetical protein
VLLLAIYILSCCFRLELGHNWGAAHDPTTADCSPNGFNGGSYIMHTYSVSGYDTNNHVSCLLLIFLCKIVYYLDRLFNVFLEVLTVYNTSNWQCVGYEK